MLAGGLSSEDIEWIVSYISQFPEIEEAILFGSRAKGSYKKGSDVDIALKGDSLGSIVTKISGWLNDESPMPYYFDILDFHSILNRDLIEHIHRVGVTLWKRER